MIITTITRFTTQLALLPYEATQVCPVAPEGAQGLVDQIIGWIAWALVWVAFPAGILLSIGAIIVGKWISHPGAAKAGVIGLFVVIAAAILYITVPGIVAGFLGEGCVTRG